MLKRKSYVIFLLLVEMGIIFQLNQAQRFQSYFHLTEQQQHEDIFFYQLRQSMEFEDYYKMVHGKCWYSHDFFDNLKHLLPFNFPMIDMASKVPEYLREYDVLGLSDTVNNAERIKINNENRIERSPDGKIFPKSCRDNCNGWTIDFMLKQSK
jgi:hypothetical protein